MASICFYGFMINSDSWLLFLEDPFFSPSETSNSPDTTHTLTHASRQVNGAINDASQGLGEDHSKVGPSTNLATEKICQKLDQSKTNRIETKSNWIQCLVCSFQLSKERYMIGHPLKGVTLINLTQVLLKLSREPKACWQDTLLSALSACSSQSSPWTVWGCLKCFLTPASQTYSFLIITCCPQDRLWHLFEDFLHFGWSCLDKFHPLSPTGFKRRILQILWVGFHGITWMGELPI